MKNKLNRFSFVLTFLCAWLTLFVPTCLAEWPVPPPPTQDIYLVDDAAMVTPEDRQSILTMGRDLDKATKAQIVVVTMNTLGDESIESYANRMFRTWGIGDQKKNNGVLLLIAKEDRKFRIEVGYGLEGVITDGYSGEVLDSMKSAFRNGNYSPAIVAAYGKLTQKAYEAENMTTPENVGTVASSPVDNSDPEEEEWSWLEIALGVVIGLVFLAIILWCLGQIIGLFFMLLSLLLYLLTSGAIDLTDHFPGGGGGSSGGGGFGGGSFGGGGSSGGGFGGGSSGGGGSSDGW